MYYIYLYYISYYLIGSRIYIPIPLHHLSIYHTTFPLNDVSVHLPPASLRGRLDADDVMSHVRVEETFVTCHLITSDTEGGDLSVGVVRTEEVRVKGRGMVPRKSRVGSWDMRWLGN